MFILEYVSNKSEQPCGAVRGKASVCSSTVYSMELEARKEYQV